MKKCSRERNSASDIHRKAGRKRPESFGSRLVSIHYQARHILALKENPRPTGARKIVGSPNDWRIRVGAYRIIYEIIDTDKTVRIYRIKHRKDAYR